MKTGSKKLIKSKHWKEGEILEQHCIEGYQVEKVLEGFSSDVTILKCDFVIGKFAAKRRVPISTKLEKLGVKLLYEHLPIRYAYLHLENVVPQEIREVVSIVAEEICAPKESAYFKKMEIGDADGSGIFNLFTKEIHPDTTDRRKKVKVLGLTSVEGRIQGVLGKLSAKKYECEVKIEQIKTVICSSLK